MCLAQQLDYTKQASVIVIIIITYLKPMDPYRISFYPLSTLMLLKNSIYFTEMTVCLIEFTKLPGFFRPTLQLQATHRKARLHVISETCGHKAGETWDN